MLEQQAGLKIYPLVEKVSILTIIFMLYLTIMVVSV